MTMKRILTVLTVIMLAAALIPCAMAEESIIGVWNLDPDCYWNAIAAASGADVDELKAITKEQSGSLDVSQIYTFREDGTFEMDSLIRNNHIVNIGTYIVEGNQLTLMQEVYILNKTTINFIDYLGGPMISVYTFEISDGMLTLSGAAKDEDLTLYYTRVE